MQINSLQDLYETKIQLIADAEQQALKAYPRLLQEVRNQQLRQALQTHMQQSERQLEQVRQLSQQSGKKSQQQTSASMQALIHEAQQMLGQIQDPDAKDAFLVGAVQAMEHHEIAAYGTARSWAQKIGRDEDASLLNNILNEEKQTDEKLTHLAEQVVNQQAAQADREVPLSAQSESGGAQTSKSQSKSRSQSGSQPGARSGGANANVTSNRNVGRESDEPDADI
jgi:ferritin-like metal-binding protein YciE